LYLLDCILYYREYQLLKAEDAANKAEWRRLSWWGEVTNILASAGYVASAGLQLWYLLYFDDTDNVDVFNAQVYSLLLFSLTLNITYDFLYGVNALIFLALWWEDSKENVRKNV
jgi:hypothetical protein